MEQPTRKQLAAEARGRGEKLFTDSTPCKRNHHAPFYASSGNCVQCCREANALKSAQKAKVRERFRRQKSEREAQRAQAQKEQRNG